MIWNHLCLNIGVGKAHGGGGTRKLTPEQLRELVTEQGGLIKHRLQRLVSQSWYKSATDSRRRKAVQTILKKSRTSGRKKFLRGQSSEERRRIHRPGEEPVRFPFGSPPGGV